MKNFDKMNNLIGWGVWLIATLVYFLTIEPTTSWWDCGEYIATAYKLQVGHPPGAPFFQLTGRIFSLFAFGDVSKVALMINGMSALASSFTILFLFWSITILARKAALLGGEMTKSKMIAVFGSGVVGALAYTFSDSFWFSAVEGEVYAMSSFFTAFVFWAILKWEAVADEPHSARWLVLIAYMIGLSIGVHLLNLLAIPAIAFVYYFKKNEPTTKGMVLTGLISILVLSFIMYGIIPEVVNLFGHTELLFVNTLRMPFNSGTIFLSVFLVALLVFSILATNGYNPKHKKIALVLGGILYLLILIESSSVGTMFIRFFIGAAIIATGFLVRMRKAQLNTIILSIVFILIGYSSFLIIVIRANTNTPINENDPKDAVSLLAYLNREQYGTWPLLRGQYYNSPIVDYEDGNPVYLRNDNTGKYEIADSRTGTVPVYDPKTTTIFPRMWSNSKPIHVREYKDWGRVKGVPVRTINREGQEETIMKPTFGENLRYFFRYQIGFMYFRYFLWNYAGRQNDIQGHGEIENGNWQTGLSFLDERRLGPQDNLPFSRQNRANNKFFLLPLLLGLGGLFFQLNRDYKNTIVTALLFLMTGLAIVVYLNQHPYQPRERDYAYAGSTYAFAIWIGLGVLALYNVFKKVMNANISAVLSTVLTLALVPGIMATQGWDDHNRSGKYATLDFAIQYLESCEPNAVIFTNGDNDTFPLWYAQEVEGIRTDIRVVNYMLASGEWYIHQKMRKVYDSERLPFTLSKADYDKGSNNYVPIFERVQGRQELIDVIGFIKSSDQRARLTLSDGSRLNFIPTKQLKITVNRNDVIENGLVPEYMYDDVVTEITWDLKQNYVYKNDLMMLDFIATNQWKRPVYFTSPAAIENVLDVAQYCHLEGVVYRLMPVRAKHTVRGLGGINTVKTYDRLVNNASWGNLKDPKVYVDPESRRNSIMPKQNYLRLAQALVDEGEPQKAIETLDTMIKYFPNEKMPFDMYMLSMVETYYDAEAFEKGNAAADIIVENYRGDLDYYASLKSGFRQYYQQDIQQSMMIIQQLSLFAARAGQTQKADEYDQILEQMLAFF